jgi:hypothetical protein
MSQKDHHLRMVRPKSLRHVGDDRLNVGISGARFLVLESVSPWLVSITMLCHLRHQCLFGKKGLIFTSTRTRFADSRSHDP